MRLHPRDAKSSSLRNEQQIPQYGSVLTLKRHAGPRDVARKTLQRPLAILWLLMML